MADPNEAVSNTAPEETSLHDELASAYEKASKADEPVPETQEEEVEIEEKAFAEDKAARQRDETGKFVAKDKSAPKEAKPPKEEEEAPESPETPEEKPTGPKLAPPPGWSATAKAAFNELPKPVQEAVARREEEINKGFAVLKNYKQLDPYVEMAERSGTNLPEALQRYVAAEQLLERDPVSGIKWLCQNYNLDPRQLIDGQAPQQPMMQPTQADPTQYLAPVMQKLSELEGVIQSEREAKVAHEIDSFFNDTNSHPYAENVADQMAAMLKNGQAEDLTQAYDKACWENEEIRELLIKERFDKQMASQAAKAKATANQARVAGNSITGGPSSTPPTGSPTADDLRAQIASAFQSYRA